MLTLMLENISPQLYTTLEREATFHHRSLTEQALWFLEQGIKMTHQQSIIETHHKTQWLKPIKPVSFIDSESVISVIREARDDIDETLMEKPL